MDPASVPPRFNALVQEIFGDPLDSILLVEERARQAFGTVPFVVWEGNPQTFEFEFVSDGAETILGYPATRWTREATFWVDQVVHPLDRDDAVAYCALATCKGADHCFEYRAVRSDASVVWLRDIVRVVLGPRRLAIKLRGIMFDITCQKTADKGEGILQRQMEPSMNELHLAP